MKHLKLAALVLLNVVFAVQLYPLVYGTRVVAKLLPQTVLIQARVSDRGGWIGSGVVISDRGHILTVAHLVDPKVKEYKCKYFDGVTDTVRVIGFDKKNDLALMRVDHPQRVMAVASISKGPVLRGADVIIVGYPLGLEFTVTRGIVSGLNRLQIYNQSDAVANPGNSGGPVFDRDGKLIGILSAGMPAYPFFTGQSLFVKLDLIKSFLEDYRL